MHQTLQSQSVLTKRDSTLKCSFIENCNLCKFDTLPPCRFFKLLIHHFGDLSEMLCGENFIATCLTLNHNILGRIFKGALGKHNIYLLISKSIRDIKLDQYWNFQLIPPMRFHFMRYFVNTIISSVSHRLLHCVLIEVNFEK